MFRGRQLTMVLFDVFSADMGSENYRSYFDYDFFMYQSPLRSRLSNIYYN